MVRAAISVKDHPEKTPGSPSRPRSGRSGHTRRSGMTANSRATANQPARVASVRPTPAAHGIGEDHG